MFIPAARRKEMNIIDLSVIVSVLAVYTTVCILNLHVVCGKHKEEINRLKGQVKKLEKGETKCQQQ